MDATQFNQMVLQNSEDLDLTQLFSIHDDNDSVSNPKPRSSTPFFIRDILGLNKPSDVLVSGTHESRVRSPPNCVTSDESSSETDDSSEDCPNRGEAKSERRQAYSSYQVRELEQAFTTTSYPGRITIEQLAQLTDLTPKQVRIWFQNRRQKYKNVARSGGRDWILRSAPRVLRSDHPPTPEPRDLSVQSNLFLNNQSRSLPSQHQPINHLHCQRMLSGEAPIWSPALTTKVPVTRRVPKFHPYAMYRSVPPILRQSSAERSVAMAALMRQQKIFSR